MDGKEIVYCTKMHWIVFARPIIAFIVYVKLINMGEGFYLVGSIIFFQAIYWALSSFFRFISYEFAITNMRVLMKHGFIKRQSLGTLLTKIEGIQVYQGLFGRLFNYGTIIITGTGGTGNSFHTIKKPMEFRKIVQEQISRLYNT